MKKLLVFALALANIGGLVVLFSILSTGHATQLTVDDLAYGAVDLDGDGEYTEAEDLHLEWLLDNQPDVIDQALKIAKIKPDGGVDLSPYLSQFGLKDGKITLYRNGQIITENVDG